MFYKAFLLFLHKTQKIYRKNIDLNLNLGYNVNCTILHESILFERGEGFGYTSGRYSDNEKKSSVRF